MESKQKLTHTITRLGMELALAVNDYNSNITEVLDDVQKLTIAYLTAVKLALSEGVISNHQVNDYFALVGQSWGSIRSRFENEYLEGVVGAEEATE